LKIKVLSSSSKNKSKNGKKQNPFNQVNGFVIVICLLLIRFSACTSPHNGEVPEMKSRKSAIDSLNFYSQLCKEQSPIEKDTLRRIPGIIISLAKAIDHPYAYTRAYAAIGSYYFDKEQDSSYNYLRKGLDLAETYHYTRLIAQLCKSLGVLNNKDENYNLAIVFFDSAIVVGNKVNDFELLSDCYNFIGLINLIVNDTSGAHRMFDSSCRIAVRHHLSRQKFIAELNIAQMRNDIVREKTILKQALKSLNSTAGVEPLVTDCYNNLGYAYPEDPDSAIYFFSKGYNVIKGKGAILPEIGVCNNLVCAYIEKGELQKAGDLLVNHCIPMAVSIKNDDWLSTLYDTYGDLLKAMKDFQGALIWKERSVAARIKSDKKTASNHVRLLSAMLDLKNKEREIADQRNRVQQFRFILINVILLLGALVLFFIWRAQRNLNKLQSQQITSARKFIELEENEKERTARDLHDITGKFVLTISDEIERIEFPDNRVKGTLLANVETIGKSLRKISHRLNRAMIEKFSFDELILGYCEDFYKISQLPIEVHLPENNFTLPGEIVLHIYRIIQELLTNASKYAKDGLVEMTIEVDEKKLQLFYRDTGPGFEMKDTDKTSGMGFMNIYERVRLLGGTATPESSPGNGTEWTIIIPYGNKNK